MCALFIILPAYMIEDKTLPPEGPMTTVPVGLSILFHQVVGDVEVDKGLPLAIRHLNAERRQDER